MRANIIDEGGSWEWICHPKPWTCLLQVMSFQLMRLSLRSWAQLKGAGQNGSGMPGDPFANHRDHWCLDLDHSLGDDIIDSRDSNRSGLASDRKHASQRKHHDQSNQPRSAFAFSCNTPCVDPKLQVTRLVRENLAQIAHFH